MSSEQGPRITRLTFSPIDTSRRDWLARLPDRLDEITDAALDLLDDQQFALLIDEYDRRDRLRG